MKGVQRPVTGAAVELINKREEYCSPGGSDSLHDALWLAALEQLERVLDVGGAVCRDGQIPVLRLE